MDGGGFKMMVTEDNKPVQLELPAQHGGSESVCDWLVVHFLPIRELGYKIQKKTSWHRENRQNNTETSHQTDLRTGRGL